MNRFILFLLLAMPLQLPGPLAADDTPDLRSRKRGVCATLLESGQVQQLAQGVSWVYNWGATPANLELNGEMEFIPMVWGANQGQLDGVKEYLDGGATPSHILVLNEPNLKGQAFITPQETASWMEHIRDTLAGHDIPLIGPQMALGSASGSSIVAYDPILGETVTYTSMDQFLDAFDYYRGDAPLEGIAVHPYGVLGELTWAVDNAYSRYGKPVWVTEFAYWNASSEEELYDYAVRALDFLEHSPKVGGYAWFMANINSQLKLVDRRSGALTPLGELYVNYPAFDPDHFHPVPGRVDAESYSGVDNMMIVTADSAGGWGALTLMSSRREGWINFQIDVAEAGLYGIRMRVTDTSYTDLGPVEEGADLVDPPEHIERDLHFDTRLEAGPQTFRILIKGFSAKIDWLEFTRIED